MGHEHDSKASGMEEVHRRRLDLLALAQDLGEVAVDANGAENPPVHLRPTAPRHYEDVITTDEEW